MATRSGTLHQPGTQHPHALGSPIRDRAEQHISGGVSGGKFPIQDDEAVSELVRTPSRASADLHQHADLENDLGPVLHVKEGGPTKRDMLEDLLRRVERIEKHRGIHES